MHGPVWGAGGTTRNITKKTYMAKQETLLNLRLEYNFPELMFYPGSFWDIYILNKSFIKYKRIKTFDKFTINYQEVSWLWCMQEERSKIPIMLAIPAPSNALSKTTCPIDQQAAKESPPNLTWCIPDLATGFPLTA